MRFIKFYNENIQNRSKQNVLKVQEVAKLTLSGETNKETRGLVTKIENKLKRWGSSSDKIKILNKIVEDYDYAMEYAKTPTKQNISEELQSEYLKLKGFNLEKLPSSGEKSMRFVNGEIVYGVVKKDTDTKSFDFQYLDNTFTYNKVTTTGFDNIDMKLTNGGGQKSQFNDALSFVKQANLYCEKYEDNKVFVLIVDGDYYTDERINLLKKYENKRVKITNSDEFKG